MAFTVFDLAEPLEALVVLVLDDFTEVLRFLLPARLGAGSFEDAKVARLVRNFLTPCSSKSMRRYASSTAITDPNP
ncbi:MAG: hypothetical protein NZ659_00615 [Acidimicrobiales bacterium]|nr:hypothetical protein [Acidimicrobiales bacterium]